MKPVITIILILMSHMLVGQNFITISGKVFDAERNLPLAYAHIGIGGKSIGTVSNENGEFDFHIPSGLVADTLIISYVGYQSYRKIVSLINRNTKLTIHLTPNTIVLDEAVVDNKKISAKQLVQEALEKIRENYSTGPFVLEGFFRDWSLLEHADSTKRNEGTLLEAAVSIYDNGYSTQPSKKPQETIYISEIRRNQQGENWEYTWNSLQVLLKQNYVHYPQSKGNVDLLEGPLNFPNDLLFSIHEVINNTNEIVYVIKAVSPVEQDFPAFYHLHLRDRDLAILRIDLLGSLPEHDYQTHIGRHEYQLTKVDITIRFQSFQGRIYPSYLHRKWSVRKFDKDFRKVIQREHYSHELLVNKVITNVEDQPDQNIGVAVNPKKPLEKQMVEYNPVFWANYNIIKENPLEAKVAKALDNQNQSFKISARVSDVRTKEPLVLANVYIKGTAMGTVTNEIGEFEFNIPVHHAEDTLIVSYLGYGSYKSRVKDAGDVQDIRLKDELVELNEILVQEKSLSAGEIVQKAIDNIPKVYPNEAFLLQGFYRDWFIMDMKDGNQKASLAEAAIIIDDKGYGAKGTRVAKERVYITEVREIEFPEHRANNFQFFLQQNPIRYKNMKANIAIPGVLDLTNDLQYQLEDIVLADNGEELYVISAAIPENHSKYMLYISSKDYAMLRIDLTAKAPPNFFISLHPNYSSQEMETINNTVRFRRFQGKPYLSYMRQNWSWEVNDSLNAIDQGELYTEFLVNNVYTSKQEIAKIKRQLKNLPNSRKETLFDQNRVYNQEFWDNYNIVKSNPLNQRLQNALKKSNNSFDVQFENTRLPVSRTSNHPDRNFTRADSIKGQLTPLRTSYDVGYYHLNLEVDPSKKLIHGVSNIKFRVEQATDKIQIDLYEELKIEKILWGSTELEFNREYSAVYLSFPERLTVNRIEEIDVYYSGRPLDPDWSIPMYGAFVWTTDQENVSWLQAICQGNGAHGWWPNKDHLSDEPDSAAISITVPSELQAIANGQLQRKTVVGNRKTRYDWKVSYPINNYNLTLNVGNYHHFQDHYINDDSITIDYYVTPKDSNVAKKAFLIVKPMLKIYEDYFGPYPFPKDGFTLIQTPYPMEHQSCVAIGKNFEEDLILHESAHEWWGNSISCTDYAELWIHEAFATYAVALFKEKYYGVNSSWEYFSYLKSTVIGNDPLLGVFGVNHVHYQLDDMYSKGALMLNTLRNVITNDSLWFKILKGIQSQFRHRSITTSDIVQYVNSKTGNDFTYFFDQYLKYTELPELQLSMEKLGDGSVLRYRWKAHQTDFRMPVKVGIGDRQEEFIYPTTEWQNLKVQFTKPEEFKLDDKRFYVKVTWN